MDTILDTLELEMTVQINDCADSLASKASVVNGLCLGRLERLGTRDTTIRHKAKDAAATTAWRRDEWKEEAPIYLPRKRGKRGHHWSVQHLSFFFFFLLSDHSHQVDYFVTYGACWVGLCCHNPPNPVMDYRIFIVCTDVNACICIWG